MQRGVERAQGRELGASRDPRRSQARGWGAGKPSQPVTALLLEPERGSKKQHAAWGMTMSSVSLESKKQGRESKVEAGELEEVSSEMAGGLGLFCWLGRTRRVCPTQADCLIENSLMLRGKRVCVCMGGTTSDRLGTS